MSEFKMPTTAGSIVSFDAWKDATQTTKIRHIITLIPGDIDIATGEILAPSWTDSWGEKSGIFNSDETILHEAILASNPELIFEASEQVNIPVNELNVYAHHGYGATVILDKKVYGCPTLATLVPVSIDENNVILEAVWLNTYGQSFTPEAIEKNTVALIVEGLKP